MALRDFLERFRPAGAPGAAAVRGVPADRVAERAAELEPLLAVLSATEQEAERIRADARAEAARLRAEATRRAEELLHRARTEAAALRAESIAQARATADDDSQVEAAVRDAVSMVDALARARMPDLVHQAEDWARRVLDADRTVTGGS
ncbi:hypothetical protein [Stackebrandtia nassauensis]|uniref:Uncharacterized protein n=1 Tax=Stackebrandtia nassauensis (strain DSM 44728 / CIP 108903 / NRRL B-16338 / NBRC 102104 / LLR-40K-21) TaxID=446470 RepID=D3PVK6_STANL|nr:hypothetical protein [Stackebrandtia nassauensis]ADD43120.1 conserved hypothetical protein [Stackebrandtia nassauensis DSM 44728]